MSSNRRGGWPATDFTLSCRYDAGLTEATLTLGGDIDGEACERWLGAAVAVIAEGATSVTFDCAEVTSIDSGALSVIAQIAEATRLSGGIVRIHQPNRSFRRILEVSGLLGLVHLSE